MKTGIRRVIGSRWFLAVPAVIVALATVFIISLSLSSIRTSGLFQRALRRIEILDRRGDYGGEFQQELRSAAEHARNRDDWMKLLRSAWRLPGPDRWRTVYDLAATAAGATPSDASWRIIGSYAALRAGDPETARTMVLPVETADLSTGETVEFLYLLAAMETGLLETNGSVPHEMPDTGTGIVEAVLQAMDRPDQETLWRAWEKTGVTAFALNSALYAARTGNSNAARRGFDAVADRYEIPGADGGRQASLYLATWLGEGDRVFRQLRQFPDTREAVSREMLLLQADINMRQSQLEEARRIYRELQEVHPESSPLPFFNDAILTERIGDGDPDSILDEGLGYHPDSEKLLFLHAAGLIRRSRREEALTVLGSILASGESLPRRHDYWLLTRVVRARIDFGRGVPPERLESDLWTYLNRNPDAHQVATFLARLSSLRRDQSALDQLASRYTPQDGPWAATLHLMDRVERNSLTEAEEMLPLLVDREDDTRQWTGRYNRALFALRFLPLSETEAEIEAFRAWLERSAVLPPEADHRAQISLLLLEAELARIRGNNSRAVMMIDRAIDLNPDNESLYSYRTLLAPRD
jgi:tetratricopeptide (TPR) repeat protein